MFKQLSPKQKKVAVALGGAVLLALVAMLSRRREQAAAPAAAPTTDPAAAGYGLGDPYAGSTFADNGSAMGGFTTAVTDALGGLGDRVGDLESSTWDLSDTVKSAIDVGATSVAAAPVTQPPATPAAPAAPATPGLPAWARDSKGNKRSGVYLQDSGPRAGQYYEVVHRNGRGYRNYHAAGVPLIATKKTRATRN